MPQSEQEKTIQFEVKKDLSIQDALMFATHYHQQGDLEQAKKLYQEILKKEPKQIDSLHNLGLLYCQQNLFEEGLPYLKEAVQFAPQNIPFYLTLAQVFKHLEQFDQSEFYLKQALANQCEHIEIYYWLGEALLTQQKFTEAREILTQAAHLDPEDQDVQRLLSYIPFDNTEVKLELDLHAQKQLKKILKVKPTPQQQKMALLRNHEAAQFFNKGNAKKALTLVSQAIELNPKNAGFYNNRAIFYQHLNQFEKAISDYLLTIALNPSFAEAYNNLGQVLNLADRLEDAKFYLLEALKLNQNYPEAHNNLGIVLQKQLQLEDSKRHLEFAIKIRPEYAEAYNNLGILYVYEENYAQAESEFRKAILFQKNYVYAYLNLSRILVQQEFFIDAREILQTLTKIAPSNHEVFFALATLAFKQRNFTETEKYLNKTLKVNPSHIDSLVSLAITLDLQNKTNLSFSPLEKALQIKEYPHLYILMTYFALKSSDWDKFHPLNFSVIWEKLIKKYHDNIVHIPEGLIFWLLSFPYQYKLNEQLIITHAIAKKEVRGIQPINKLMDQHIGSSPKNKLRIGYVSSDMNNHTVGEMLRGIFKRHDKTNFEIYIYSTGISDQSPVRKEIENAANTFHNVEHFSAEQIAKLIYQDQIDILVDLNNWTQGFNPRIFAYRPAPVQVTWGGTPSTTGLTCIDYILIDKVVAPVEDSHYYTEKLVYLPDSHIYANQDSQIAENVPSRTECHLPESAFVFCCFCNHYKIEPMIFDIWMSILRQEPNSVLWLLGSGDLVNNLKNEAEKRGVDPERLIFAPRKDHAIYLAQYRNADLFLDTYFMTGAATTCDALWAGLPVLTCLGQRYGSRVSASALNAIKLPELIMSDLEEYEERALFFARHPEELLAIREKVETNRLTTPLFDTDLLTQNIEQAYLAIWDRHQQGLTPDMIDLTAQ